MVRLRGEEALVQAEQRQRELKVNIEVSERLIGEAQERLDSSRALIARSPEDSADGGSRQPA